MSQLGIFNTFDEETILAIQAKALSIVMEGKTIMRWDGQDGSSVGKEFTMPISDVLEECNFTLKCKFPETYGYYLNRARPYFA